MKLRALTARLSRTQVAGQWKSRRDEEGMTTAEYAVGTVAACGFAGILYQLLTSDVVTKLLSDVIKRALTAIF